jgi:hypothetical protein
MNQNNPLDQKSVIPAKAGIQMIELSHASGPTQNLSATRGLFLDWIPAFAGMTD